MILEHIDSPADLRSLTPEELAALSAEIRGFIVDAVTATGGHLGSNLGVVELTLALHRTFDSPKDVLLWDTGHQAYVHKLVTGRRAAFTQLRQADGLSGYPNRTESEHDWVENSHASTILSYAHGLASAFELQGSDRRVVAVVGDGALTGGMAYEALNNLGHSGKPVLIVLNDNGRSYAPTVSRPVAQPDPPPAQSGLRPGPPAHSPSDPRAPRRGRPGLLRGPRPDQRPPRSGHPPHLLRGPGHPLRRAHRRSRHRRGRAGAGQRPGVAGPIVVHVLTQKGRGYAPAEEDDIQRLHDVKVKVAAVDRRGPRHRPRP